MTVRVAINGFGRIGRLVMRAALEHPEEQLEVVGINDLGPVATNAHLLNMTAFMAALPAKSPAVTTGWMPASGKIRVTAERDPAKLPWRELGVDVALECTGIFTKREAAAKHLEAGAKKRHRLCPGRWRRLHGRHGRQSRRAEARAHRHLERARARPIASHPSPMCCIKGLGIERGYMTTIHAYTGDQSLPGHVAFRPAAGARRRFVDDPDLDRGRAGDRAGVAGAEGQARRYGDPGADRQRVADRLDLRCGARHHAPTRSTR